MVEKVGQVLPDRRVSCQQPEVLIDLGGLGVVVAGANVAIAPQPVLLAPDHEDDLRVGLETDEPVDHVHARAFELAGPDDVRLLIKASLHLDKSCHLLALLGRAYERRDDGRVLRGAIEGLFDGEHVRILGGLGDERLNRGRERVVGVMDQNVALSQHREQIHRAVPGRSKARLGHGHPGRLVQVRPVDRVQRPELAEPERGGALIDVVGAELELCQQQLANLTWSVLVDLEAAPRGQNVGVAARSRQRRGGRRPRSLRGRGLHYA